MKILNNAFMSHQIIVLFTYLNIWMYGLEEMDLLMGRLDFNDGWVYFMYLAFQAAFI